VVTAPCAASWIVVAVVEGRMATQFAPSETSYAFDSIELSLLPSTLMSSALLVAPPTGWPASEPCTS
jgi:hypothetical protein